LIFYLFSFFLFLEEPHRFLLKERILPFRVSSGTSFVDLLNRPLPFKIPIYNLQIINQFPAFFEYGSAEYEFCVDSWIVNTLLSYTSEQAVVILDGNWQSVIQNIVTGSTILLDQHDLSSQKTLRPDFTAMFGRCIVMKAEAKASMIDMMNSSHDLIKKFHKHAFKLFPKGCLSIPGVNTCNEALALYSISFFNNCFSQDLVKTYDIRHPSGRVNFIVDLFKIIIWILSQTEPTESTHLVPDVRIRTSNGHHITLTVDGILKEFDQHKLNNIRMDIISAIYALHLPNVEHGITNCKSITITRIGSRLKDAVRARLINKSLILDQIRSGIEQLHSNGYAHCDICVDNIFVDSEEDGGKVFLGDLEYCRKKDEKPPQDIRRANENASTAEELDLLQFENLRDELASI